MEEEPDPERVYHGAMGTTDRPGVLLVNLGTPEAPTAAAVRRYLRQFLLDRRVVDAPRLPWWLLLNLVILPRRSPRSAALYREVWTPEGSPLLVTTERQASLVQASLSSRRKAPIPVVAGMRYGSPPVAERLRGLQQAGCPLLVILPLFPQYSATTVGSVFDAVAAELATWRRVPELRFISGYAADEGYLEALEASVRDHWKRHGRPSRLLLSFHGLPVRYTEAGDPYPAQCETTARLLAQRLGLDEGSWALAYQSRFGREPWLGPDTAEILEKWGGDGLESVDVLCPGFAADCLETLEEIAVTGRKRFLDAGGGTFRYVPALNVRSDHVDALASLVLRSLGD